MEEENIRWTSLPTPNPTKSYCVFRISVDQYAFLHFCYSWIFGLLFSYMDYSKFRGVGDCMLSIYCIYAMEKETFERLFLYYKSILFRRFCNLGMQHRFKGKKLCMSMLIYFSAGVGASRGETTAESEDQLVKAAPPKLAMHHAGDESRGRASTVEVDVMTEANHRASFQASHRASFQASHRAS